MNLEVLAAAHGSSSVCSSSLDSSTKLVYSILMSNTTDQAARSYMENGKDKKCGRTAWFSIEALYEGSGNNERIINNLQSKINHTLYTMNGQGSALLLSKRLFDW